MTTNSLIQKSQLEGARFNQQKVRKNAKITTQYGFLEYLFFWLA